MGVVVPRRGGLAELERALTPEALALGLEALRPRKVALSLPRFRVEPEATLELAPALRALGIRQAFTAEADLTGMAAAATAVEMYVTGVPGPSEEPLGVVVDRPFLFVVRDRKNGALLFIGRMDP
jgi:serine protease inhibitor